MKKLVIAGVAAALTFAGGASFAGAQDLPPCGPEKDVWGDRWGIDCDASEADENGVYPIPSVSVLPPTTPPTTAQSTTTTTERRQQPPPSSIPRTGSDIDQPILAGATLAAMGLGLVVVARRRRDATA